MEGLADLLWLLRGKGMKKMEKIVVE